MSRPSRTGLKRDFAAVRRVLMADWNPLGVEGLPDDEYDSYVWPLLGLLRLGADDGALLERLRQIESRWFGQAAGDAQLTPIVEKLRALGLGKAEETRT